jgi:hypothetical protein
MSLAMSLVAALVFSSGSHPAASENRVSADARTEKVEATSVFVPVLELRPETRGASSSTLKVLYGSYFSLQGLDVYSTAAARRSGAHEVNPMMRGSLGQALAVKTVTGLTTYYAVNRMAKKNKTAAIVTMAVLNGVTAAVVVHNMKAATR